MALLTAVILGGILLVGPRRTTTHAPRTPTSTPAPSWSWPTRRRSPRCRTSTRGPRLRRSPPRLASRCTRGTARSWSTRGRPTPWTLSRSSAGAADGHGFDNHDGLPNPLGNGLFGTGGSALQPALTMDMGNGAYVKLSEGPASGRDALVSAALAWILAAALAVGLAALAGYLVAARIARPVVALTEASDRMAAGDLGARAPVAGRDEVGRLGESFNGMAARVETTVTSCAASSPTRPTRSARRSRRSRPISSSPSARRPATTSAASSTARSSRRSASRRSRTTCCSSRAWRPATRRRRAPRSTDLAAVARELADSVGLARRAGRHRAPVVDVAADPPRPCGAVAAADRARQPARQRGEVHAVGRHGDAHRAP